VKAVQIVEMGQGQKQSRMVAWSFHDDEARKGWRQALILLWSRLAGDPGDGGTIAGKAWQAQNRARASRARSRQRSNNYC
jgi:hypothetical protein